MKTPKSASYKWKLSPVNLMDMPRFQDWLNQMARQGLFYHWYSNKVLSFSLGAFSLVRFQVKTPDPNRRYRLHPAPETLTEPPADLLAQYQSYGWTYVDYIYSTCVAYFLFTTDNPAAAEPYASPDDLYRTLRFPIRNFLFYNFSWIVLVFLVGFLLYQTWAEQGAAGLVAPELLGIYALLIFSVPMSLFCTGTEWLIYFLLRRKIKQEHTTRPTLPRWLLPVQRVFAVVQGVLILVVLLVPGGSFFRRMNRFLDARHEVQAVVPQEQVTEDVPLEDWEPDFDLLTLAEMEGDGSWVPTEDFVFSPAVPSMTREFHYNVVDLHEAPEQPIPIWYTINQDGTGNSGTSSLSISYYLARDGEAAQARLERERTSSQYHEYQLIEVPGTEAFWYYAVGLDPAENVAPAWFVLARKGDRLLSLRYDGYLDLTEWYDEIAAMLTPVE